MTQELNSRSGTAAVALLDALGTRNLSIQDARKFVRRIKALRAEAQQDTLAYLQVMLEEKTLSETVVRLFREELPELILFGDTILILWPLPNVKNKTPFLIPFAQLLSSLFVEAMDQRLLLRGAMSIGEFVKSENVVVGPAITDAASWYEVVEWAGIICTPHCSQFVCDLQCQIGNEAAKLTKFMRNSFSATFQEYDVPLKGGAKQKLWCVNWPAIVRAFEPHRRDPIGWYYRSVQRFPVPKGTEAKQAHTRSFFLFCLQRMKQIYPEAS